MLPFGCLPDPAVVAGGGDVATLVGLGLVGLGLVGLGLVLQPNLFAPTVHDDS